ncbi:RIP metalloprotease RseP, partial [Xanthomonas translucens]
MGDFIGSVWWMIVSLGVLVTFHEYGHFWVARRCGVKVLRFSVGFGKPLWSYYDRHGTEFAIAAIPLGGYVKMLDEREGEVAPAERDQAFNNKHVWQRIAIVAAGPVANLVLCVALLWAMFVIGKQDYAAIVGRADGLALQAGLQPGERIVRIGTREVSSWSDASMQLTVAAMDRADVRIQTEDSRDGATRVHTLRLSQLPADFDEQQVPRLAGLTWRFALQPAIV